MCHFTFKTKYLIFIVFGSFIEERFYKVAAAVATICAKVKALNEEKKWKWSIVLLIQYLYIATLLYMMMVCNSSQHVCLFLFLHFGLMWQHLVRRVWCVCVISYLLLANFEPCNLKLLRYMFYFWYQLTLYMLYARCDGASKRKFSAKKRHWTWQ